MFLNPRSYWASFVRFFHILPKGKPGNKFNQFHQNVLVLYIIYAHCAQTPLTMGNKTNRLFYTSSSSVHSPQFSSSPFRLSQHRHVIYSHGMNWRYQAQSGGRWSHILILQKVVIHLPNAYARKFLFMLRNKKKFLRLHLTKKKLCSLLIFRWGDSFEQDLGVQLFQHFSRHRPPWNLFIQMLAGKIIFDFRFKTEYHIFFNVSANLFRQFRNHFSLGKPISSQFTWIW